VFERELARAVQRGHDLHRVVQGAALIEVSVADDAIDGVVTSSAAARPQNSRMRRVLSSPSEG
jgi:hypothetical protein